jgi:hypothetical protein
MSKRAIAVALCTLAVGFGAGKAGLAASDLSSTEAGVADAEWQKDVTVVAIAPDGTWGVGTDDFINRAIALAIADCKRKYQREIGCGYRQISIRAGWSLVYRCGSETIIVAARELAEAERQARRQEHELRSRYVPGMPACERTGTVDPHGVIVPPTRGYSAATEGGR